MVYKLIGRIQDGQNTVGYQLLSGVGKVVNLSRPDVITLAANGNIVNAEYIKATNSLKGTNDCDLRKLPVIQAENNKNKASISKCHKSNHDLAREYMIKQKITGEKLKLELLDGDRVRLLEVVDKQSSGKIVIPSFVTCTGSIFRNAFDGYGPFNMCNYTEIIIDNKPSIPFDAAYLCSGMRSEQINVEFRHPECVTSLHSMFHGCIHTKEIKLVNFNTTSLTDTEKMFRGCANLKDIDISSLITTKVTRMTRMFSGCKSIERLDLRTFDTGFVIDMSSMFEGCESLKYIDLSTFSTKNTANMSGMFFMCSSLVDLNLRNFTAPNLKICSKMFSRCKSLQYLDISNMDLTNTLDREKMFEWCRLLRQVKSNYHKLAWLLGDSVHQNNKYIKEAFGDTKVDDTNTEKFSEYNSVLKALNNLAISRVKQTK